MTLNYALLNQNNQALTFCGNVAVIVVCGADLLAALAGGGHMAGIRTNSGPHMAPHIAEQQARKLLFLQRVRILVEREGLEPSTPAL